ncbi:MAG: M20/M25/M40 family metallo-hydrolase [Ferruginibacter sp.]|nr:M20/M25/M40 family metallo-hydrolase [Ferruginibacter sp.]
MKKRLTVPLLLLFSVASYAQNSDSILIKKIADEILINGVAYENLRYLCKQIGPRLSGSVNAQKAVLATAKMLRDAGADTVYLQPCMVPHWIRGEKESGYIETNSNKKYQLHLCALGNSVGSGKTGVKGEVVQVTNFAELNRLGEAGIRGKIVFFNIPMNPAYVSTFQAYGEAGIGRRSGSAQAARYGAVGVMVRSLASNVDDYPHTGVTQYNDSFPKIPAVAISTSDAEWLSKELSKKNPLNAWFQTTSKMLDDVTSFNVIGELRGEKYPAEIITVGGHLGSWDLAEGAQDDGAGVVQSIEVIRALKAAGIQPKRTVRAVLFMNEENGGRGAEAYLQAAKQKKEQHIFALESDGGGFTPRGFGLEMNEIQVNKVQQWKSLFYPYGVYQLAAGGSGSDVKPLRQIGTPLAGLNPDSQRYFDLHHAATDIFESVSKRELHLGAVNMAMFVWLVSEYGL